MVALSSPNFPNAPIGAAKLSIRRGAFSAASFLIEAVSSQAVRAAHQPIDAAPVAHAPPPHAARPPVDAVADCVVVARAVVAPLPPPSFSAKCPLESLSLCGRPYVEFSFTQQTPAITSIP